MADNVTLNAGSGGASLATDDIGGVHYQLIKLGYGALDNFTIVSTSNPLPVSDAGGSLTIDGSLTTVSTVTSLTQFNGVAITLNKGASDAGTLRVSLGDGAQTIGALTANQSVNVAQLAGTTTDTNSGTKSAGTLRVVLATDQPALTNKLLVTPDLPSGASTAAKQPALGTAGTASTDVISVQGIASMTPVQVSQATASNLNAQAVGSVAHDGADAGNPVKVGGRAVSAEIAAVANNDRSDFVTDLVGKQIVLPYANPEQYESASTSAITDTTSTQVFASAGAGVRHYVTTVIVTNSHATVGTFVKITDGSGGTVLWQGYAAAVGGGFSSSFPVPLRGSAATALHAICVTTGANVIVSAAGYKGA